jgi:hypothetical protein
LVKPIGAYGTNLQAAIVAGGLRWHWRDGFMSLVPKLLKEIAAELDCRFSIISRSYGVKSEQELFSESEIHREERNDSGF